MMLHKLIVEGNDSSHENVWNFLELFLAFFTRCNYHATLQGLVLSNHFRRALSKREGIGEQAWLTYEMFVNSVDDVWVVANSALGFVLHLDLFNLSVIAGKIVKVCFQLYLEGLYFQPW